MPILIRGIGLKPDGAKPRDLTALLIDDDQLDRITRRACSHRLGGHRTECGERLGDSRVLALEGPGSMSRHRGPGMSAIQGTDVRLRPHSHRLQNVVDSALRYSPSRLNKSSQ